MKDVLQLSPAPVSRITGMPNAFLSLVILAGVIWMYHGKKSTPMIDSLRRFATFLLGASTMINLGAAVTEKYYYLAVWSEPLFKVAIALLTMATLTEKDLWSEVFDAWGRLKPRQTVNLEPHAASATPKRPDA